MDDLLKLIKERQSTRVPFNASKPIPKRDLKKVLEAARWAPTAHNMQNFDIVVVDDKKILADIHKIKYPTSITFVRENYKQLSFSVEELRKRKTGVLGTMFPPAWRNPNVTEKDITDNDAHNSHDQLMETPVLLLVVYDPNRRAPASEGDFLGIMSLGCMMQNMWLMAESLGLGFHVVSSLSNYEVEKELKKMLNIPAHLMIAISFRLGYPVKPFKYLRVRRDVEDFAHYNGY
jgi:nitroreductase